MPITDLRRWERVTYHAKSAAEDGEVPVQISMELRRLKRHEAKVLHKALVGVFKTMEAAGAEELTPTQKMELLTDLYEKVGDEQLRQWFETWVRDVRDLSVDGKAVTTGVDLFTEVADDNLISFVLLQVSALARLTPSEKKGSGSPSISSPELGSGSSDSPATSTGPAGTPESSTAPETLPEQTLSSVLVEA